MRTRVSSETIVAESAETISEVYGLAMASPEWSSVLELYQHIVCRGVVQYLEQQTQKRVHRGIYTAQVVLWLMILQALQRGGSLGSAVQLLREGAAGPLLFACRRVRRNRISGRTGGYCQARLKLPKLLCRQVSQEILDRLRQILNPSGQPPVLVLDGTSLELEHSRSLLQHYPPAQNQYGRSHWPVLRVVVLHEATTGLAQQPCWGPMYGPAAVSEQALAEEAMDSAPRQALLVADRNFGVFSVAYAAQQRGLNVVVRLTQQRAHKFAGPICQPGCQEVVWKPSSLESRKHGLPEQAAVAGRLISVQIGRGKSQQWLHLFTTSHLPMEEVLALYSQRWNIETDLRSLKRTVQLHHISARSPEMMEKHLLMAISAYNLVRAVLGLAARRSRIDPRQLSFTQVLTLVDHAWHRLISAPTKQQHDQEFFHLLDLAAECTLPRRRKRRSYSRQVWSRRVTFPVRKAEN
jgi:putative transposase